MGTGVLSGSRGHFLPAGWGGPAKDGGSSLAGLRIIDAAFTCPLKRKQAHTAARSGVRLQYGSHPAARLQAE